MLEKHIKDYGGVSLCSYFWITVAQILLIYPTMLVFAVIACGICIIISPFLLIAVIVKFLENWSEKRNAIRIDRQPGLLRSWVSAKKDKVCPLIKFED